MKYNRFLPLIVPLLSFVLFEIIYLKPGTIYVILIFLLAVFLFTARQFVLGSIKGTGGWWNFAILPVCFSIGLITFCTMLPSKFLVQSFFVLNFVFLYSYFISIYYFLIKDDIAQKYSLENISSYGNFLAFYFIASSIYGLQAFLNIQISWLMFFLMAAIILIVHQMMWAHKIDSKINFFHILIICLVLVETAWSISFLTLSFYILGLILALCYYVLISLVKFYLLGTLNKKIIKTYLIFGLLSLLMVLLTARWL